MRYNRHRYYDPNSGRFISKDPIGLEGGLNAFQSEPNPFGWLNRWGCRSNVRNACQVAMTIRPMSRKRRTHPSVCSIVRACPSVTDATAGRHPRAPARRGRCAKASNCVRWSGRRPAATR
ncbi:hypothetical protein CFB39_32160 [Burkholderia sp. AU6039]|nr:RHS repeat-associated core domain-containing protein [Burkholderia sp. AU6039]OXJ08249.1 hypothetical protein CFB39_32160 [Burkholderia sp. AU6039]